MRPIAVMNPLSKIQAISQKEWHDDEVAVPFSFCATVPDSRDCVLGIGHQRHGFG